MTLDLAVFAAQSAGSEGPVNMRRGRAGNTPSHYWLVGLLVPSLSPDVVLLAFLNSFKITRPNPKRNSAKGDFSFAEKRSKTKRLDELIDCLGRGRLDNKVGEPNKAQEFDGGWLLMVVQTTAPS